MRKKLSCLAIVLIAILNVSHAMAEEVSATDLVRQAVDHFRGLTSYSEMTMIIHRPDWERSMTMRGWTQGDDNTLVRVTEPRKDAGNGTLMLDGNMWTFSPKINRVIKVPSSMMGQSWMGSDFSNKDISKSTDILDEYEHTLLETYQAGEHTVYVIESVPHEEAAVVWGKEVLFIRDDFILLEQQFWDQDDILVKSMKTREIKILGGRTVASIIRMGKTHVPDEWTEISVHDIRFDASNPDSLFTLSSLRNPRQ